MPDMIPQGGLSPQFRPGHHEIDDVRLGTIIGFAAGLVILTIVVAIGLGLVMRLAQVGEDIEMTRQPPLFADSSGLYAQAAPSVYAENPVRDRDPELARQSTAINTYGGSVSEQSAQIPLDRALDIIAQRGLPEVDASSTELSPSNAVQRARVSPRVPSTSDPAPTEPAQNP